MSSEYCVTARKKSLTLFMGLGADMVIGGGEGKTAQGKIPLLEKLKSEWVSEPSLK